MPSKFKRFRRALFIIANILAIILYLLSCLVPFINSGKFWFIAILGLAFPLLFFLILVFLIYNLFKKSKWVLIYIPVLILSWQQISVMFSFHVPVKFEFAKSPETLRVLTWNISCWGETNRRDEKNNMIAMAKQIKYTGADVLCLQEFLIQENKSYEDSVINVLKENGYQYGFFAKTSDTHRIHKTEVLSIVAIFSKYPIIDTAEFDYNKVDFSETFIYADLKINKQNIRFFTTHLQSVSFETNNYEALSNLENPYKENATQLKTIVRKLRYAYKNRATQAEMMNKKISESPYPVIVCGDFNDIPNSYTYFKVKGDLQDAFLKRGSGFGRTFRFISPTLRIDYILADKKFEVTQFTKINTSFSDHYPIIADFNFSKN